MKHKTQEEAAQMNARKNNKNQSIAVQTEEALQLYRENKTMEPLFRMYKLIAKEDELKAATLLAVAVQYISDHFMGRTLMPSDVQQILRAVLLQEENGYYYALYLLNEIQVKVTGWLLILAADLPVNIEQLGQLAEDLAAELAPKQCVKLEATDVLDITEQLANKLDPVLLSRIQLNRVHFLQELRTILMQ